MKGSIRLGNIAGIGVFVHWTFAILIGIIIFNNYRAGREAEQILWTVLFLLSIFGTVFLHELGHAMAAKRYGIKTTDITLLPIGGLARLEKIPEKPKEELIVAIAGPAVNIGLAIITSLWVSVPEAENLALQLTGGIDQHNFLLNFLIVNVWLAIFNLIPAFPMDGGRILRAILSMRMKRHVATRIAARIGQILAVGFVFAGFYTNPFLIFIGFFIFLGAQAEAAFVDAQSTLAGYTVSDVLMKEYHAIPETATVRTAAKMLLEGQCRNFLVTGGDNSPVGTLSREAIIRALSDKGEDESVSSVMNRDLLRLSPEEPLENAYRQMQLKGSALMPVVADQGVVGVLDLENILEFIMIKNALAKRD